MSSIPKRIGNYELEQEIGHGATSEVWLARHIFLEQRQVAIKILMAQDRETVQRFSREAQLTSRLSHPNIVRIYDHGYYQPFHCTVMEYVHGGSLHQLLEKHHRLQPRDALLIFKQIAAALDYAHSLNIIHRDVSPGNVLIEQTTGRALLTDFGIARDTQKSITASSTIMGTPGYLSPEHVHSAASVTQLSDIYSLGVILYVMLSGELPWNEVPSLPDRQFGLPLPLKERGVTNVPHSLDRIFQVLLAEDPAKRFPSAKDAVDELERLFMRHHIATQVVPPGSPAEGNAGQDTAANGPERDIVEEVLGPDLIRDPITAARKRAERLSRPEEVANLLNAWSEQSPLRRALLGRLARVHKVKSRNVYFYSLHILYEHRSQPYAVEEPDHAAKEFPLEPETDHWLVALPPAQGLRDEPGGPMFLPGSARVVRCDPCSGRGVVVCPQCKGKGRVTTSRAPRAEDHEAEGGRAGLNMQAVTELPGAILTTQADTILVPCPACDGRGGFTCQRCEGVGRLVQYKEFQWRRSVESRECADDVPGLDEEWLLSHCEPQEVYYEEATGDFRPEWSRVPELAALIQEAQVATSADVRTILSAVSISFIPISDIFFDLGHKPDQQGKERLYRLSIYGFEEIIPPDWRFLDWQKVSFVFGTVFMTILVLIFGFFAFWG